MAKEKLLYRNFDALIVDMISGLPQPYYIADGKGGQTILVDKNGVPVPMSVRIAVIQLMMANLQDDNTSTIEERLQRHEVSEKLRPGGNIGLTLDEITLIKKICDKAATVPIAKPIRDALANEVSLTIASPEAA